VLEQFRILEAARRLSEFTAAELARESGAATDTVEKTLQRHSELFDKGLGPLTGRRSGRAMLYWVRPDARRYLETVVQEAADAPELPSIPAKAGGKSLGTH